MRWVVGDIHGCASEFDDLLRAIRFVPDRDELWCTGDIVNTGPDSLAALRLWRDVGGRGVIGNHDAYAILARTGRAKRRADRLDALYGSPEADALLARLRACPAIVRLAGDAPDAPGVWLVHAGLNPTWTDLAGLAARIEAQPHDDDWLASEAVSYLTRVRCCDRFGERIRFTGRPGDAPPPFRAWDDFYDGEEFIVHGHWAMRGCYRGERTMGLDSACVYGGRLTAWSPAEDRTESVPCRVARGYLV